MLKMLLKLSKCLVTESFLDTPEECNTPCADCILNVFNLQGRTFHTYLLPWCNVKTN